MHIKNNELKHDIIKLKKKEMDLLKLEKIKKRW